MIVFEQVSKRFADGTTAVDALDLSIRDGELTVLVGPSGCGKTTTLRLINRLEEATTGRITVGDRPIDAVDATELRRGIGYVMQHSGLFPHRTIADNIATVPRLLGWSKADVRARVDELIRLVGLDAALGRRYPHQLSGGQQQRVGVARALAADPPILLMDEPFAAVDPIVRARLQDELLSLQARLKKTIVFVTHDIDEAIRLGDRIAIFATGGRLAQHATPADLLARPADDFVADFLGGERDLKRLALITAAEAPVMTDAPIVPAAADDEAVATAARAAHTDWVVRRDDAGAPGGWQQLSDGACGDFDAVLAPGDSLRRALSLIAISPVGVVPRVDAAGRLDGLIGQPEIRAALARDGA